MVGIKVKKQRQELSKNAVKDLSSLVENAPLKALQQTCLIIFEQSKKFGYREIKTSLIPEDSIPILDKGTTHFLNFDGNSLTAIPYIPKIVKTNNDVNSLGIHQVSNTDDDFDETENTPQTCYEALFWEELIIILSVRNSLMEKIKLAFFWGIVIVLLILLVIIVLQVLGAHVAQ